VCTAAPTTSNRSSKETRSKLAKVRSAEPVFTGRSPSAPASQVAGRMFPSGTDGAAVRSSRRLSRSTSAIRATGQNRPYTCARWLLAISHTGCDPRSPAEGSPSTASASNRAAT
jgi:hypothetical protein